QRSTRRTLGCRPARSLTSALIDGATTVICVAGEFCSTACSFSRHTLPPPTISSRRRSSLMNTGKRLLPVGESLVAFLVSIDDCIKLLFFVKRPVEAAPRTSCYFARGCHLSAANNRPALSS